MQNHILRFDVGLLDAEIYRGQMILLVWARASPFFILIVLEHTDVRSWRMM